MTGDERHGILGAKENNLTSIENLYRFGNREELMQTRTDQMITAELLGVIGNYESNEL